jgi:hypothetical protein
MTNKSIASLTYCNPWLVMPILVLIVYGTFLAAQWSLAAGSLHGFISFHERRVYAAEANIPAENVSKQFGYDGQFSIWESEHLHVSSALLAAKYQLETWTSFFRPGHEQEKRSPSRRINY